MSGRATIRLRLTSGVPSRRDPPSLRFRLRSTTTWPAFVRLRHGRRVGVASDSKMPERSASRTQRHSYRL